MMEKKKCEFCATEYWEPPGGHECFSVSNQLIKKLFDQVHHGHVTWEAWQIMMEIERLLKKGGE